MSFNSERVQEKEVLSLHLLILDRNAYDLFLNSKWQKDRPVVPAPIFYADCRKSLTYLATKRRWF